MIYLLISIILSVSMSVIIKIFSKHELNMLSVTTTSYLASMLVSLYMVVNNNLFAGFDIENFSGFSESIAPVLASGGIFSANASVCYAIILGGFTGIFYLLGFILIQVNIKSSGVAITNIFMRGAVIVPLIFAFLVFKENLIISQIAGIILCIAAIVLSSINSLAMDNDNKFGKFLLLTFCVAGFIELSSKLFERYALIEYMDIYLLSIFISAFIASSIALIISKQQITRKDALVGVAVSLPNLFTTYFMVLALDDMKASIVYVFSSAGAITLTLILGKFIFKEKLNSQQIIAILLTIVSVIFINIA